MMPHPQILAAFLSPALFAAGAVSVGVPILIHLLARRRFKRIRWATMEFLIDAERRNRRRIRMEEWILLALRCLALLLIGLMIARPFVRPEGAAAALSGARRTERVFVIDDSFSMGHENDDGTAFDRAKKAIRRLIENIREEAPDDTVTLVRTSSVDQPIESGTFLDDTQADELLARLEALDPSEQALDPSAVFMGIVELLQRAEVISAVVYVISDFQRADWVSREVEASSAIDPEDSAPAASSVLAPLTEWAANDRGVALVLVDIGDDEASNRAVVELAVLGGPLVAGTMGHVRARVANYFDQSVEDLEVVLMVGQTAQSPQSIGEIGAGQIASVELEVQYDRSGSESVRVRLPEDALPIDDVRYVVAEVSDAIRVLVVDGEPSTDNFDDEVHLLTTALRPHGELYSGNEIVTVDETQLDATDLKPFHVVILANVYRIGEPAIDALTGFVRGGGGLIVFLGDQVDPDLYNLALYRDGDGLLPAELTAIVRPSAESHLVVTDRLHPVLRGLSREGDPLGTAQIGFYEYFACNVVGDETHENGNGNGTSAPDGRVVSSRAPARVVARFDTVDGLPFVIERPLGLGHTILVTSSADKEWNDWADHPTYLPVMMELVRHAARTAESAADHWVGTPIELPIDPSEVEPDAVLRTPGYPAEREIGLTASSADDGHGMVFAWERTDRSGIYRFLLRGRDGREVVRSVAVNVAPGESDLTPATEAELRQAMPDLPFQYISGIEGLDDGAQEARTELWPACLLAAMACLMTEHSLAWWFGRRAF